MIKYKVEHRNGSKYLTLQSDQPMTLLLCNMNQGGDVYLIYQGLVDPNDTPNSPLLAVGEYDLFSESNAEKEVFVKPPTMKKPYRVFRLSKSSRASGSNIERYRAEESNDVVITHSSDAKFGKGVWQHWLRSQGVISWFIETQMDATELLEYLELEVMFDA